ncbi:hypothetical protein HDK64DRAFT_311561 [Phyllosticta capitalensis]
MSGANSNFHRAIGPRCDEAWSQCQNGNTETGFRMARLILLESRLGDYHRANMNLLLTKSGDHAVEHGEEAVRLYTRMLEIARAEARHGIVSHLEGVLQQARDWLKTAQEQKAEEDKRWENMTAEQIQKAKIKEMPAYHSEEEDEQAEKQADTRPSGTMPI